MRRLISIATMTFMALLAVPAMAQMKKDKDVTFTVVIENISDPAGQVASDGSKWPFALSPGMWVVHEDEVRLYREGNVAPVGLEAQAEDGNPAELVKVLHDRGHDDSQHGIFNTPAGTGKPGPIGPGGSYSFQFTARPGMRLSLITMFGQSNDWFYATKPQGIDLFQNGRAINGDVTSEFMLFDAGTEKDEEPGIGPNQGPRQSAPNTGPAENGKVRLAKSSSFFKRNGELFRVTVTSDTMASIR